MILPGTRLLWALTALTGAAIGVAIFREFQPQWAVLAAALGLACLVDLLLALRVPAPLVARLVPASLALGVPVDVRLRIRNLSSTALSADVHDHHPASFECQGMPRRISLKPNEWTEIAYEARPLARGGSPCRYSRSWWNSMPSPRRRTCSTPICERRLSVASSV